MEEHDNVSGGFSPIPRSDLKIGGAELDERLKLSKIQPVTPTLNSGGTASKDIEKANEMSQVGKVSESFVKEGMTNKTQLLGQKVKSSSSKLVLNADVDCDKRALLKRCDNADAVSSCLNDDLTSVCSSRRSQKTSSMDVYSECGSSNGPVAKKDPMKVWTEMKQNGYLSNPHGGISTTSSSCLVSSSHGGIPAPRKRGRKKNNIDAAMAKKRKIEIARKEEVDRFARLAAPSGLLNELNPGIINHVRNKKQVLSIIENIVKSERDAGNFYHSTLRHSNSAVGSPRKNLGDVNTDAFGSDFNQGFKYAMPKGKYSMRYYDEKCADDELSEENNTVRSRFHVAGKFSENASSLSSEDASDLNSASVLTVNAATVASQWLELLHQDLKGRVSALRRSKKRVRAVVTTELPFLITKEFPPDQENDPTLLFDGASRASTVDVHKTRWMTLFKQLEHKLSEEESQLESWLNQVRYLQSHCDQGLQHLSLSSGQNFLHLGMPLDSRAVNALMSDKDLVIKAAAASIFSTCSFLEENITCS
ncbi:unnamed protein product [Arabidopsis lyrata]|uniref:uncharacterized protein LOC9307217 isoform X1 n=1 Tax=Arabidopsis lyrata subsp. lyrata TaxID=81972 RepID=UPI000A29D82E|nr:uncharacterized protein LOC9307217 isoform X1 [Arabidopsis lyrata subsp. lyrata]CAH8270120.1 unnamed protein product [Arabidopsis lyrata]|eukprot:XP_020875958.1 uncharacterized protein LOC9307217 isoform X1 [Arabidopsis lyrata subsp. lyrata]